MRTFMTRLGVLTGHPVALVLVIAYGVLWYVRSPETFNWAGTATLATWVMTVLIQRATHRDTQALHAKIDELLHATQDASSAIAEIDNKEPEDIVLHRQTSVRGEQ